MTPIAFGTMINTRNIFAILFMASVWLLLQNTFVFAQVSTAVTHTTGVGDLGTRITAHGHTTQIIGGTRSDHGRGTNLFHSFDQFNIGQGDTAQFLNTTPSLHTDNILSRVTGGNPSSIFGTIDTMSYPGANLFLMNPAGIVFGPSATLNVGGSVAFTTADYLRLADANGSNAGIFHADPTATNLLTSASVTAFGFLGSNPAAIAVQGSTLTVQPGQSISLVGGTHEFTYTRSDTGAFASVPNGVTVTGGHLQAPGGQISMVSVASPGEILAGTLDHASNLSGQSFGALGTVQIAQGSKIDVSDVEGGTILIRGGRLVVDDSTISANSTRAARSDMRPHTGSSGSGIDIQVTHDAAMDNGATLETNVESGASHESGGVRITANHITISGGLKALAFVEANPDADIPFGIRSNLGPGSTAVKSGDISLNATSSIQIKELGQIKTVTESNGTAGHITLKASGNIDIDSSDVSSRIGKDSRGNSGNIRMDSQYGDIFLTSSNVFNITDGTTGTLGNIQMNAHDLHLRDASKIGGDNTSTQIPGNTEIILSGQLSLASGSFINTETFGSAKSADLIIKSPTVQIVGKDSSGRHHSGLYTDTISSGDGGHLRLFTDNLQLRDGGILSSKSFIGSEGQIPSGRGGVINVEGYRNPGTSITIDGSGSGIFTSAQGTGAAGDISVKATSVTLQNGGKLSAETTGTSPKAVGGSIIVNATDQVTLTNGGSITASSAVDPKTPNSGIANAGNISINAGQQLEIDHSTIKTTTDSPLANGGNIDIRAIDRVRLVNNSEISTSVKGAEGSGGNIFIDPNVVILQGSNVTAEAVGGAGGNITFVTPVFLTDLASRVSATSQRGASGTVNILSPLANLSSMVGQLVSKTSPAQVLLQNRCVALAGGEQSTFIVAGRDTLPSEPGGWLSSPLSMDHLNGQGMEHAAVPTARDMGLSRSPAIASPADETQVLSLRRLTPPGFLVRTFATGSTGCPS